MVAATRYSKITGWMICLAWAVCLTAAGDNPLNMILTRQAPVHYTPGENIQIQLTLSADAATGITSMGIDETVPTGWTYVSQQAVTGTAPAVSPTVGTTGVLGFAWISTPSLPIAFIYTLNVPADATGTQTFSGRALYRQAGGQLQSADTTTQLTPPGGDTAPVITLLGDNPVVITKGVPYVEPGYSATDAKDGDLTAAVTVQGTVDVMTPGTYILTYSVSNSLGMNGTAQRTVQVKDAACKGLLCCSGDGPATTGGPMGDWILIGMLIAGLTLYTRKSRPGAAYFRLD